MSEITEAQGCGQPSDLIQADITEVVEHLESLTGLKVNTQWIVLAVHSRVCQMLDEHNSSIRVNGDPVVGFIFPELIQIAANQLTPPLLEEVRLYVADLHGKIIAAVKAVGSDSSEEHHILTRKELESQGRLRARHVPKA